MWSSMKAWYIRHRRRLQWVYVSGMVFALLMGVCAWRLDRRIAQATADRISKSCDDLPQMPVGLVLLTSREGSYGINLFYKARLRAAVELYQSGKVRGLLLSGDNSRMDYNEPQDMKDDLIKAGVPAEHITLDYAGFRTLDSIIRARKVFGQHRLIVVSQAFHCERALYLADHYGIEAYGLAADDVTYGGNVVRWREVLARTVAFLDVNVLGTGPRFLGPKEAVALKPE